MKSSTRSGTSSPEQPSHIFFTDRDLGKQFPVLLRAAFTVQAYHDHYRDRTVVRDDEWIAFMAERGWVGMSRDWRIRYEMADAVMTCSARVILLKGNASNAEMVAALSKHKTHLNRFISSHAAPYVAKFRPNRQADGSFTPTVEIWLSRGDWLAGLHFRKRRRPKKDD